MAFGNPLVKIQVIRFKLADMARLIETAWAFLETVCYQIKNMGSEMANQKLGGLISLLKVQCTQTLEFVAREAVHVFGGNG